MRPLLKKFKECSKHVKIFWVVSLGLGILTTSLCIYPYIWFDQHRSTRQISAEESKNDGN